METSESYSSDVELVNTLSEQPKQIHTASMSEEESLLEEILIDESVDSKSIDDALPKVISKESTISSLEEDLAESVKKMQTFQVVDSVPTRTLQQETVIKQPIQKHTHSSSLHQLQLSSYQSTFNSQKVFKTMTPASQKNSKLKKKKKPSLKVAPQLKYQQQPVKKKTLKNPPHPQSDKKMPQQHYDSLSDLSDPEPDPFAAVFDSSKNSQNLEQTLAKHKYNLQRDQILHQYEQRKSTLQYAFKNYEVEKAQRLKLIQTRQKVLMLRIQRMQIRAEMERDLIAKREEARIVNQQSHLIKNMVFSLISESEKMKRFAQLKGLKSIAKIQDQKDHFVRQYKQSIIEAFINSGDQFGFVRFAVTQKKAKKVVFNQNVCEAIASKFRGQEITYTKISSMEAFDEYLGRLKFKKNADIPSEGESMKTHEYKISFQSDRMPNLRELLIKSTQLPNEKPGILDPDTFEENDQLVSTKVLQLFGDPSFQMKDPRLFYCYKQSNNQSNKTVYVNAKPVQTLVSADCQEVRTKAIKGGNQIKVFSGSEDYAILTEAQLKHLPLSSQFNKYSTSPQHSLISSFYVLEEESLFHVNNDVSQDFKSQQAQIINKNNQKQYLRRICDFELLQLAFFHQPSCSLKAKKSKRPLRQKHHRAEIKFEKDLIVIWKQQNQLLKPASSLKIDYSTQDQTIQEPQDFAFGESSQITEDESNAKYFLVDKLEGGKLVKQYFVKAQFKKTQEQKSYQICQWPSCHQQVHPCFVNGVDVNSQEAIKPQSVLQPVSRKRPESGYGRKTSSALNQTGSSFNLQQATVEKLTNKKLNRLSCALELDLNQSVYFKFIKKQKVVKEKNKPTFQMPTVSSQVPVLQTLGSTLTNQKDVPVASQDMKPNPISSYGVMTQSDGFQKHKYKSNLMYVCVYHAKIDSYLKTRFQINLQPAALSFNNFFKGLKNYVQWENELKGSLARDVMFKQQREQIGALTSNKPQQESTCATRETIIKINHFAVSQFRQVQNPTILCLIECLQKIPQQINIIEHFYNWINTFVYCMSPLHAKHHQYSHAGKHFLTQLKPLTMNLNQIKANEKFINSHLAQWQSPQIYQSQKMFLKDNFKWLVEIIHTADVISRFQQFQYILDRMNQLGPDQTPKPALMSQVPQSKSPKPRDLPTLNTHTDQQEPKKPVINPSPYSQSRQVVTSNAFGPSYSQNVTQSNLSSLVGTQPQSHLERLNHIYGAQPEKSKKNIQSLAKKEQIMSNDNLLSVKSRPGSVSTAQPFPLQNKDIIPSFPQQPQQNNFILSQDSNQIENLYNIGGIQNPNSSRVTPVVNSTKQRQIGSADVRGGKRNQGNLNHFSHKRGESEYTKQYSTEGNYTTKAAEVELVPNPDMTPQKQQGAKLGNQLPSRYENYNNTYLKNPVGKKRASSAKKKSSTQINPGQKNKVSVNQNRRLKQNPSIVSDVQIYAHAYNNHANTQLNSQEDPQSLFNNSRTFNQSEQNQNQNYILQKPTQRLSEPPIQNNFIDNKQIVSGFTNLQSPFAGIPPQHPSSRFQKSGRIGRDAQGEMILASGPAQAMLSQSTSLPPSNLKQIKSHTQTSFHVASAVNSCPASGLNQSAVSYTFNKQSDPKKRINDRQQNMLMTYSNAMPRLASANVYHSKQPRGSLNPKTVQKQQVNLTNRGLSAALGGRKSTGFDGKEIVASVLSKKGSSKSSAGFNVQEKLGNINAVQQKRVSSGVVNNTGYIQKVVINANRPVLLSKSSNLGNSKKPVAIIQSGKSTDKSPLARTAASPKRRAIVPARR